MEQKADASLLWLAQPDQTPKAEIQRVWIVNGMSQPWWTDSSDSFSGIPGLIHASDMAYV